MKFKKDVEPIATDDFWYDLFEGGYIKPKEIIDDPSDLRILQNAISVVEEFRDQLEKQDLIEYI
jgi:hypothetical protein